MSETAVSEQSPGSVSQQYVVEITVGIVASIAATGGSVWLGDTWTKKLFYAIGVAAFIFLAYLGARLLTVRTLALRVYREVSASRCHDHFLGLARYIFRHHRRARRYLAILEHVAIRRKHPNLRTFQTIQNEVGSSAITAYVAARVRRYLHRVTEARPRVRAAVKEHLQHYLMGILQPSTFLVLYGYSKTICEALADLEPFPKCTIIVVEDQQYGKHSHREHRRVIRALGTNRSSARVIKFNDLELLLSQRKTLPDIHDKPITLRKNRTIVALIGCEAYTTEGDVLIPAQVGDSYADSGTFVEFLQDESAKRRSRIVVVAQSYKLHTAIPQDGEQVLAPAGFIKSLAFLLTGNPDQLSAQQVRLVRLKAADTSVIIDDTGRHHLHGENADLRPSLLVWEEMTRPSRRPEFNDPGFVRTCDAYVFDMNGVLINDEHIHFAAFAELVREHDHALTFDEYRTWCSGKSDVEGIDRLLREGRVSGDSSRLLRRKEEYYLQYHGPETKLYPGAKALVQALASRGKQLYLMTASTATDVDRVLSVAGMEAFFPPDKRYFNVKSTERDATYQQLLDRLELEPGQVAVVDDSPANLALAQTLRLRTIGVATTCRRDDLPADQVVANAADLHELCAVSTVTTAEPERT